MEVDPSPQANGNPSADAAASPPMADAPIKPSAGTVMWANPIIRSLVLNHFSMDVADKDGRKALLSCVRVDNVAFEDCVKRIHRVVKRFPGYSLESESVVGERVHSLIYYMRDVEASTARIKLYCSAVHVLDFEEQAHLESIETAVYGYLHPNLQKICFYISLSDAGPEWQKSIGIGVDLIRDSDLAFRNAKLVVHPWFLLKAQLEKFKNKLAPFTHEPARTYTLVHLETNKDSKQYSETKAASPDEVLKRLQPQFRLDRLQKLAWYATDMSAEAVSSIIQQLPAVTVLQTKLSEPLTAEGLREIRHRLPKLDTLHLMPGVAMIPALSAEGFLELVTSGNPLDCITVTLSLPLSPLDFARLPNPIERLLDEGPRYPQISQAYIWIEDAGRGFASQIAAWILPFFDLECEVEWSIPLWCLGAGWSEVVPDDGKTKRSNAFEEDLKASYEQLRRWAKEAMKARRRKGSSAGGGGSGWRQLTE